MHISVCMYRTLFFAEYKLENGKLQKRTNSRFESKSIWAINANQIRSAGQQSYVKKKPYKRTNIWQTCNDPLLG